MDADFLREGILAMGSYSAPGPNGGDGLSSREIRILADIEHDLSSSDPGFARRLDRRGWSRVWSMLPLWQILLLVPVLLALLVAAVALSPATVLAVLMLLAVMTMVWKALGILDRGDSDGGG